MLIHDQALCNARGAKDRIGAVPSDTKAKYNGLEARESSSVWSVPLGKPAALSTQAEKTLSAPKAVALYTASLFLSRYYCVISHFCHITETADETAKSGP